jgi:hypothetical protein
VLDSAMPVKVPLQMICEEGVAVTLGIGLTVTSTLMELPTQVAAVGVMTYLTTAAAVVEFISVWAMELPAPFVNPVAVPLTRDAV